MHNICFSHTDDHEVKHGKNNSCVYLFENELSGWKSIMFFLFVTSHEKRRLKSPPRHFELFTDSDSSVSKLSNDIKHMEF